jgi:hypothetical protein
MATIARYAWDDSLTYSSGSLIGMNLSAIGFIDVAPATDCKDLSCLNFLAGSFLKLPTFNFGQQVGLSFSLWFKPTVGTNEEMATILDIGGGIYQNNIIIRRDGSSDTMLFSVYRTVNTTVTLSECRSIPGVWLAGEWRHLVWSMSRESTASQRGAWYIYFDGILTTSTYGLYPADVAMTSGIIGKGNSAENRGFAGYMDSFYIFPAALNADEALSLYTVSFCTVLMTATCVCAMTYGLLCYVMMLSCIHSRKGSFRFQNLIFLPLTTEMCALQIVNECNNASICPLSLGRTCHDYNLYASDSNLTCVCPTGFIWGGALGCYRQGVVSHCLGRLCVCSFILILLSVIVVIVEYSIKFFIEDGQLQGPLGDFYH